MGTKNTLGPFLTVRGLIRKQQFLLRGVLFHDEALSGPE